MTDYSPLHATQGLTGEYSFREDSESYFKTLSSLSHHAKTLQIKEEESEKKLIEFLPVNERMSMGKEQKVLARWEERQREWERIESMLSKKLAAKLKSHRINKSATARPLMMTTTDEYRAKVEEYDLIQAAIPIEDKVADNWQRSLRGGGAIHVSVGHIFSGLECEIDVHSVPPKMVRKPKAQALVGKNDTFLEQTDNLARLRKRYDQQIKSIRPHSLTYHDAGNLVVKAVNLFTWAEQSSRAYLDEQSELFRSTMEMQRAEEQRLEEENRRLAEAAERERLLQARRRGPKLEFLSAVETLLQTVPGQSAQTTARFRNTGSTTLYYHWRRLRLEKEIPSRATPSHVQVVAEAERDAPRDALWTPPSEESVLHVLDRKGRNDPALLKRTLGRFRESFFCLQERGELLPGETATTVFLFDSRLGGGVFDSEWLLEVVPDETRVVIATNASSSSSSREDDADADAESVKVGCLKIRLHAHCLEPDESVSTRNTIIRSIDASALYASMQDVVYACLRNVRTPLRREEIDKRVVAYFQRINAKLFEICFNFPLPLLTHAHDSLSVSVDNTQVYNEEIDVSERKEHDRMMLPLFLNVTRVEEFERLHDETRVLWALVLARYNEVFAESESSEESRVSASEDLALSEKKRSHILAAVFPENRLERFDEVTIDYIEPRWSFDISLSLNALNALRPVIAHIDELEVLIAKRKKEAEKARLRAERIAARRANGDSDDEDEEEEEEEEEESDEDPDRAIAKHPLLVSRDELYAQVVSTLHQLTLHPLALSKVEQVVHSELCTALDRVSDAQEQALLDAGLSEIYKNYAALPGNADNFAGFIAPLPSPFLSEEGAAELARCLALTAPVAEPAVTDKKGAKPPPKPAKNAPPPTTATLQQSAFYHKRLYEELRRELLDGMERVMDASMRGVAQEVERSFHKHTEILVPAATAVVVPIECVVEEQQQEEQQQQGQEEGEKAKSAAEDTPEDTETREERVSTTAAPSAPCHAESLSRIATYRAEDVAQAIVFLSIEADALVAPPPSAFALRDAALDEIGREVTRLALHGAKTITLLYEGPLSPLSSSHTHHDALSLRDHVADIQAAVQREIDAYVVAETKRRRKLKIKQPVKCRTLSLCFCASFAEIYFHMDRLLRDADTAQFEQTLTVFVLENLRCEDVVPREARFAEVESDDESPALSVGRDEAAQRRRSQFVAARPQRVTVSLSPAQASGLRGQAEQVNCDATAALEELFARSANQGDRRLWVDGQRAALFRADCAAYALHAHLDGERVVSHSVREAVLWCTLLQALPQWENVTKRLVERTQEEDAAVGGEQAVEDLSSFLSFFFPQAVVDRRAPRSLVVLGGELRLDKLRVLDELITLVDKVFITGELAVPFLLLSMPETVHFPLHEPRCAEYFTLCRALLAKARLVGCTLLYPTDLLLSETALSQRDLAKADIEIAKDARNEGAEYEGEVRTFSVSALWEMTKARAFRGAVCDIGPETLAALQDELRAAQLVLLWGTPGVCEINNFQLSLQGVVSALSAMKQSGSGSAEEGGLPLNNGATVLLFGEKTVEWFARCADSDGEMQGDLVRNGAVVTYASRDASLLRGLVGRLPSVVVRERLAYRLAGRGEWVFSARRPAEEDDDEDEDEEEDEED